MSNYDQWKLQSPEYSGEGESMNYKVRYIGLREGYEIVKTHDDTDCQEVFRTFKAAKAQAIINAENDLELVKLAMVETRQILKSDVLEEY